jgi:succinate dehydrogenase / fumarate reductase flavoprotein subunit
VADVLELGELLTWDALQRNESCGGHFRTEYQTDEGEAKRNDAEYAYAAAWEWTGENKPWTLNKEPLVFESIQLQTRSYK